MDSFYGHGKLLFTGEYAVLDGATALAAPTRQGQRLLLAEGRKKRLDWTSYEADGSIWFTALLRIKNGRWRIEETSDPATADRLIELLHAAAELSDASGKEMAGYTIQTELEFPRHWGLGTSSTLVHCLAEWWRIDPYELLAGTFGGSGYDLACAAAEGPISYRNTPHGRIVDPNDWSPVYRDQLYFVYLEQKQNSREGIRRYRERPRDEAWLNDMSALTEAFIEADDLAQAQYILRSHERMVAHHLDLPMVQADRFADFPGVVKSLGAWGGDFVLALPDANFADTMYYFTEKGYPTVLKFEELFAT
jgi:mevalonate kinase